MVDMGFGYKRYWGNSLKKNMKKSVLKLFLSIKYERNQAI